jgi:tetratricopeptide (TPR) repeat protein
MEERVRQLIALGREHYAAKEFDQAEKYLEEVTREQPNVADVWCMLGVIRHSTNRLNYAREAFEKALAINPSYTDAALNLSVTLNELGQFAESREIYSKAIARTKSEPQRVDRFVRGKIANMHAGVGAAYAGVGMYAEAAAEYRKAVDLCPTFHDLRTRLAAVYRDMGDLPAARKELEEVRTQAPDYLAARLALGLTLHMQGDKTAAQTEWQFVLDRDAGNKTARFYLQMSK